MSNRHGDPDELREIATRLEDERPRLDPLTLDGVKLRAMSRAKRVRPGTVRASLLRSQATLLSTVALLIVGSGTAIAVCGGGGGLNPKGEGGDSGYGQYKNGCPPGFVQVDKTDCCEEEGGATGHDISFTTDGKSGGSTTCCVGEGSGSDKNENTPHDDKGSGDDKSSGGACCPGEMSGEDKNENTPHDDQGSGDDKCCTASGASTCEESEEPETPGGGKGSEEKGSKGSEEKGGKGTEEKGKGGK